MTKGGSARTIVVHSSPVPTADEFDAAMEELYQLLDDAGFPDGLWVGGEQGGAVAHVMSSGAVSQLTSSVPLSPTGDDGVWSFSSFTVLHLTVSNRARQLSPAPPRQRRAPSSSPTFSQSQDAPPDALAAQPKLVCSRRQDA